MRSNGTGPFQPGDRVQLTDERGKVHSFHLKVGAQFHSHKGWIAHDEILGSEEGVIVATTSGYRYQVLRPLQTDYVLSMERGATIIYPKDAALIIGLADIAPGLRVLEAGAGSGSMSISILRAIGPSGSLTSYEERPEFLANAAQNVSNYFGEQPANWNLKPGRVQSGAFNHEFDRVVFDMLAPWDALAAASQALRAGGLLCVYVATTTQLSRVAEAIKSDGEFTEPESFETLLRNWHHEGLAVRPAHQMNAHTGFILMTRRMKPGVAALKRRRRPAKGAYSETSETLSESD